MRLILTSNGISSKKVEREFLKILGGEIKDKKILVLRSSRRNPDEYGEEILRELIRVGFKEEDINFGNPFREDARREMENNDVIYSAGGNTFTILNAMRNRGYLELIRKMIKKNKIYLGVSAGTILLQKSIEIAGIGKSGDPNYINLKDLNGLGIINFVIFPHYEKVNEEEIVDFEKEKKTKVLRIADGECFVVEK
ncbi:MAG TPA: Type 1 glutamine amidotransferase-like domain-containing protein [Candidatus Nanoarchaeia archaeon]|nr:Type 1 glutamine amidotransferase-like domain-containing protein [Candidatus Nanoarchaeia archaeon]